MSNKQQSFSRRNLVKGASFLAVLGLGASAPHAPVVLADEVDEKKKEKAEIDQRLIELRNDLTEVNSELAEAYLALAETEMKIPDAQKQLDAARAAAEQARKEDERLAGRLKNAQEEEKSLVDEIARKEQEISQSNEDVSRASMQAYMGSGVPTAATVFLGAQKPQDAVDRSMNYRLTLEAQGAHLSDLRTAQSVNVNAADRLKAVREEIADLKEKSAEAVRQREAAEAQAQSAKDSLDALFSSQQDQASSLESLKERYRDSETRLDARSNSLGAEIDAILEERARRAAEAQAAGDSSAVIVNPTGSGQFQHPIPSVPLTSPFGYRIHPIYRTRRMHNGQDYGAPCGTPIMAMADGTVAYVGYNGGAGNMVMVDHGGYKGQALSTMYFHMSRFGTSVGARVKKGQVIGYVGTTGSSTGCHLHFETRLNNTPHDPRNFTG